MRVSALVKFLIVFLFVCLFSLTSPKSFAQSKVAQVKSANSVQANFPSTNTNPDVPNNLHNWTQTVMIEVMSSLDCQLAGIDPINPKQSCLGADSKTGKIGFLPPAQKGGAIGTMGNMIAALYTSPLHTGDYFKYLASNFGISKKAYAQQTGVGFDSLRPFLNIWVAFRNIVYLFLVIVFVIIGLAIMLRVKIDPRTVMTIQNQIPKIIIGILLVTFSFAIAGFLIDMMWASIYVGHGMIANASPTSPPNHFGGVNDLAGEDVLQFTNDSFSWGIVGISHGVASSVVSLFQNLLGLDISPGSVMVPFWGTVSKYVQEGFSLQALTNLMADTVSVIAGVYAYHNYQAIPGVTGVVGGLVNIVTSLLSGIPFLGGIDQSSDTVGGMIASGVAYSLSELLLRAWIPWLIVFTIVAFTTLIALFRLWFSLIMAYVQILLDIVLAPFWIIGGIIPGSPISFGGWLKDMLANLLAFPVVIFMFMLGRIFVDGFGSDDSPVKAFVPPLIGNPGKPSMLGSIIALGIILITPNIISLLKQALKAPKTNITSQVMGGVAAGGAVPMSVGRSIGASYAKAPTMGTRGGTTAAIRQIFKF